MENRANDYDIKINQYLHYETKGTPSLIYREVANFFEKESFNSQSRVLDFGCGTGASTRFLKEIGFAPDGVDVFESMLVQARKEDQEGDYRLIDNGKIPKPDCEYDLVFSAFVMCEMTSMHEMQKAFDEIYRVLKTGGYFIFLTCSEQFYKHEWEYATTDYPQNANPGSGDPVKVKLKRIDLEITDYFWKDKDYKAASDKSGFSFDKKIYALAEDENSDYAWVSERNHAPHVAYILKK